MTMNPQSSGVLCPRCGSPWTPGAVACPRCGFVAGAVGGQPMMTQAAPPSSLWPTVLITLFFNLFGLIPAAIGSDRDRSNGHGGGRQWMAFLITWLAETLAGLVFALLMPALVLGWLGIHHDDDSSTTGAPSVATSSVAAPASAAQPTTTAQTTTTAQPASGAPAATKPAATATRTVVAPAAPAPTTAQVTATLTVTSVSVINTCGADGTGDCYLSIRSAPNGNASELSRVTDGQSLTVVCQVHGGYAHSSIAGDSDVWSRLQGGGYVSNLYLQGDGISKDSVTTVCS